MELPGVQSDTATEIERGVIAGLGGMSPEERLRRTIALCQCATELAAAGLRRREGELDPPTLRRRLAALRYGEALVARVEAYRARLAE